MRFVSALSLLLLVHSAAAQSIYRAGYFAGKPLPSKLFEAELYKRPSLDDLSKLVVSHKFIKE